MDKKADIDIFTNETCYYYPRPRAKTPLEGKYRKIVLKNGKAVGAIILGIKGESVAASKIVNQQKDILRFQEQLKDISFSLKEVLKS